MGERLMKLTIFAAAAVLTFVPQSLHAQLPDPADGAPPSVTVTGEGTAFLPPDRVQITVVLDGGGVPLAALGAELEKREKRLIDAVHAISPDAKVLSRGDRLHGATPEAPVSMNGVPAADRAVTIETSKIAAAPAITEAVLKSGAKIDSVEYRATEDSAPFEQAIEAATVRAKAKAQAAAKGLGLKLGRMVEIAVAEEPSGEAIQRERELGRDPDRFSSKEVKVFVTGRFRVTE